MYPHNLTTPVIVVGLEATTVFVPPANGTLSSSANKPKLFVKNACAPSSAMLVGFTPVASTSHEGVHKASASVPNTSPPSPTSAPQPAINPASPNTDTDPNPN